LTIGHRLLQSSKDIQAVESNSPGHSLFRNRAQKIEFTGLDWPLASFRSSLLPSALSMACFRSWYHCVLTVLFR
jgi:hypothetical protein